MSIFLLPVDCLSQTSDKLMKLAWFWDGYGTLVHEWNTAGKLALIIWQWRQGICKHQEAGGRKTIHEYHAVQSLNASVAAAILMYSLEIGS